MEKMLATVEPIQWTEAGVVMLDQRLLPGELIYHTYTDYREVAAAIRDMVIRGAPAIGVAAAMGMALGAEGSAARTAEARGAEVPAIADTLAKTRPTAVDLFWALDRMRRHFEALLAETSGIKEPERVDRIRRGLVEEALAIHRERREAGDAAPFDPRARPRERRFAALLGKDRPASGVRHPRIDERDSAAERRRRSRLAPELQCRRCAVSHGRGDEEPVPPVGDLDLAAQFIKSETAFQIVGAARFAIEEQGGAKPIRPFRNKEFMEKASLGRQEGRIQGACGG